MRVPRAAKSSLLAFGFALSIASISTSARAVAPHRSERYLPSSNGRSSIAFDAQTSRVDLFLEHPYQNVSSGVATRNFAFDSYPGIRVGTSASWNPSISAGTIEMIPGTGIVHVTRSYNGVAIDEYHFAPIGLSEAASVMLVKVTRVSGTAAVDAFAIFNYHLGSPVSGSNQPGTDNENIAYDATNDAFYEWGPSSGAAFGYGTIGSTSTHHSTQDVFNAVNGANNLTDTSGTGSAVNDAVAGFQASLSIPNVGDSAWAGWYTVDDLGADAEGAIGRMHTWVNGRSAAQILSDETSAWSTWVTPPPAVASELESALAKQAQAEIRMAQCNESGAANGQILASIAPGQWNITWVRDMAYATVALAKTGHLAEAKRALAFQMGATVGGYQTQVGAPYQISVVRYFGNGTEESDSNADGPNIEFDGFGLFLWSLSEYVKASNDTATLDAWWPTISSKIADVLVHLQEPSGLISADSSIWEVHWNGKQKHFAYTTISAANGLCAASKLATQIGDSSASSKYLAAGQKARDAILSSLRAPDGTIGQSTEALAAKTSWLDAAAIEAVNFGLFDPARGTAAATISSMRRGLVPPSGQGFMRNDDGAYYDSQEWVFVDFRSGHALDAMHDALAPSLLSWNVSQAADNFDELSELHDATTADYAGASPMVGFGSGAYLISLTDRGAPLLPACDAFAAEPGVDVDSGTYLPDASDVGGPNGHEPGDGPSSGNPGDSGGCACTIPAENGSNFAPWGAVLALVGLALVRVRRSKK